MKFFWNEERLLKLIFHKKILPMMVVLGMTINFIRQQELWSEGFGERGTTT